MPVKPTFLERLVLYRLNRGPAAMVDLLDAGSFRALALAHDLGVFEALEKPRTVENLADVVDADPTALEVLLEFLRVNDYVLQAGDRYERTGTTERWLTDDGEANLAPWFTFWQDVVFPFWDRHLETTIRTGEPLETLYEWLDDNPELWPTAQRGFRAAATLVADPVVDELEVPEGATSLLDLGGGHGLYAAELCEHYPDLSAVVFDRREALEVAEAEASERDLADRLRTRGGDYLTDDLGGEYDLVLVFNVTHAHDAETVQELFERVYEALEPGGRIAVLDQFKGGGRLNVGETAVALIALTYQVTLGRTVHDADAVARWLRDAGFREIGRTGLRRDPGSELVQARKD